ncbi:MAG: DUF1573 domain-containing protein [Planctomycetota bacterium]
MPKHAPTTPTLAVVAAALLLLPAGATAQEWATKMFNKVDHDFESVARGSDTVYKFEVTNIYKEDIHLASVRSSCGCTAPSIDIPGSASNTLKTYEKGYIVAKFNTRTFTGLHSATLTVTIDKPFPAQVQLRVHGNIRGDVVFEPGSINFGTVDQGAASEKSVGVNYAGRSGWRINDVRSASSDLEVELAERPRRGGRASYNLLVRLKPTAKPGFLKEQLVIVTSDARTPRIPLEVEGRVMPEISIAPLNLVLGDTPQGNTVRKRLIVRGKQPFRVTNVSCSAPGFSFNADDSANTRHLIDVAFTPAAGEGVIKAPIVVETDRGEGYSASCMAYATLKPAPASPVPASPTDTEPAGAGPGSGASTTAAADSPAAGNNPAAGEVVAKDE